MDKLQSILKMMLWARFFFYLSKYRCLPNTFLPLHATQSNNQKTTTYDLYEAQEV